MNSNSKNTLMIACIGILMACATPYRPFHNHQGYVILPFEKNKYRIEYYSNDQKAAETNWLLAANQICNNTPEIQYEDKYTIHGSVRTPVAGQMVDLGTQDFIHYGVVSCASLPVADLELIPAQWYTINSKTKNDEPVSNVYIVDTLKISSVKLFDLIKLPRVNASTHLTSLWHAPLGQTVQDGVRTSIWFLDGNGWAQNSVVLTEKDERLESIQIFPSNLIISVLSKIKKMDLKALVEGGQIPVYSLAMNGCN